MKKYILLFSIMLFSCCTRRQLTTEVYRITVLRGPSAIAFAPWLQNPPHLGGKPIDLRIVDSPEQMQALLIKNETDIAVLPMVSAVNLYNKQVNYALLGCPIWGTLYLVGHGSIQSPVYIFGAGTTPDILTRYYLKDQGSYEFNYTFSTAREMALALTTANVRTAVLSEPYLSTALRRDTTLCILMDLNQPVDQFAQTAIVCKKILRPLVYELDSLLEKTCNYVNQYPDSVIKTLENNKIFPPKLLTKEAIKRCRINYVPARKIEKEINAFLQLIKEYEPRSIGDSIPDSCFILENL